MGHSPPSPFSQDSIVNSCEGICSHTWLTFSPPPSYHYFYFDKHSGWTRDEVTYCTHICADGVLRGNCICGYVSVFPHLLSKHSQMWSSSCLQCLELGPWEGASSLALSNRERPCEVGSCLIEDLKIDPQDRILLHWAAEVEAKVRTCCAHICRCVVPRANW